MSSTRDASAPDSAGGAVDPSAQLRAEVASLKLQVAQSSSRIQRLETELEASRAQVAWFHRQLFGQKAERIDSAELELAWRDFLKEQEARARGLPTATGEVFQVGGAQFLFEFGAKGLLDPNGQVKDMPTPPAPAVAPEAPPPAEKPKKKGHGRKKLPLNLREETIVIKPDQIPEGARCIGEEVTRRVGVRRAELIAYRIVRPKYAVDDEVEVSTAITIAPPPKEMVPRGLLAPSGLAHILANKWDRSAPYHRLARFFSASGYALSVSTLSGVGIRAAPAAGKLVEAMKAYAQEVAPYLAIDATGVLLQQPKACVRGHVWLHYIEEICVLVTFTKTHDSISAGAQLDGWTCPTLADGAQVYDLKHRETGNPRAGCWSHARRNFVYAAPTDARALVGVKLINQIFRIEAELVDAPPELRLARRKADSAPIVKQLFEWRDDLLATGNLGRSPLAKALRYLRNQASRLSYFLEDGRMPIHNNRTELQARHLAVGRKNWLFFGSEEGAEAGAIWLSLVLSARMHGLDVEQYLRDLFRVLPLWPTDRLIELAPHRWSQTSRKLDPLEMCVELGKLTIPDPA